QRGDWAMHKLECSAMCSFGESWCPSETVRLVARILTRMKVQKETSTSEKLLLLKDLEANLDKLDNEKREMNEADIAELHHFYSKHLDFPDHQALLTLFAQVHCNGFTVEDEELSHVGSALFPDVALMNHSCCPNVIVTYRGTSAEVRAVKDIRQGDEIYTSYIDLLYPTEDRMERLRDSYHFTCDCKECKTKSKDKVKLKLRKVDGEEPRSEEIREMLRYARNAIEDFRRAKQEKNILPPPAELLEICELSIDKMSSMFEDSNVYMLHMMYQAMGVCMYMEDYDGAVSYGEKVIKPFRQLYPAYSLNVASMYLKLGRLYTAQDRPSAGSTALKKALAIMEVVHGKDHVYVTELKKEI
ncbi:N-lysine methyltransferase SMYD2-B isoform X1, partial [Silurus asotus]